jgi:hypothetical protein
MGVMLAPCLQGEMPELNRVLFANGWIEQSFRMDRLGLLKVKWR